MDSITGGLDIRFLAGQISGYECIKFQLMGRFPQELLKVNYLTLLVSNFVRDFNRFYYLITPRFWSHCVNYINS